MQTTSAQWPGCFCKKMSRSNTCRKSHFVRKIHPASEILTNYDFLRKQFSAAIEAAHFPADGTAIDACAAAIFTFFL